MTKNFQEDLIQWYQEHKRELAFRQEKNAYKIWISEIMAQQTRIEAMLPYFTRFIQELPDMASLAGVDDQRLNKLWQGLGYYSRARNLKKCAQLCMEEYKGQLPKTKGELMKLPGIGPYTAGAIASIAYDENVSAVDGNVYRVFSRLYDIHEDLKKSKGQKEIQALVEKSLPGSASISDYNQALMELGAMVCIPGRPKCLDCPISFVCLAYRRNTQEQLPVLSKAKKRRIEEKDVYIWMHQDRIRLRKRPKKGLLAGLYGFEDELPENYLAKIEIKPYTHIFSHVEWHMRAWLVQVEQCDDSFHTLKEIHASYPIPSAFLPFLHQVEKMME